MAIESEGWSWVTARRLSIHISHTSATNYVNSVTYTMATNVRLAVQLRLL
jgi:hypothetical protein